GVEDAQAPAAGVLRAFLQARLRAAAGREPVATADWRLERAERLRAPAGQGRCDRGPLADERARHRCLVVAARLARQGPAAQYLVAGGARGAEPARHAQR